VHCDIYRAVQRSALVAIMNPTLGRVVFGKEKPKIVAGPQNQKRSRLVGLVDSAVPVLSPAERKRAKKKVVVNVNVNVKKAEEYAHPEFVGNRWNKEKGLFCVACNKFVSFKKKVVVVQHCFGSRQRNQVEGLEAFQQLAALACPS
jgi:hypothetical protein